MQKIGIWPWRSMASLGKCALVAVVLQGRTEALRGYLCHGGRLEGTYILAAPSIYTN